MLKRIAILTAMLASSSAYADHAGWSSNRGGYYGAYQFINESEFISSDVTFTGHDAEDKEVVTKEPFKGLGIKTAIGTELVRFVRFSAYHLYRDLSNNPSNSMRGSEVGGDIKLNFWGPVVNLQLGLDLHGAMLNHQSSTGSTRYVGSGYGGNVGIERFIADKASITFTVKGQSEAMTSEDKSLHQAAQANNVGAALGLLLWLN